MNLYNSVAIKATLHCLTGCSIGEVLGMVLATAWGWHNAAQIGLAIGLAFVFGYGLTMSSLLRSKVSFKKALGVAFVADTVSIIIMEIVANGFVAIVPGALHASLNDWLFWWSLTAGLVIAFIVAVPANSWLISRGKGHAAMHEYHGHGDHHHH